MKKKSKGLLLESLLLLSACVLGLVLFGVLMISGSYVYYVLTLFAEMEPWKIITAVLVLSLILIAVGSTVFGSGKSNMLYNPCPKCKEKDARVLETSEREETSNPIIGDLGDIGQIDYTQITNHYVCKFCGHQWIEISQENHRETYYSG